MTDNAPDVASATEAQPAALKSTDTSSKAKADTAKPEAKAPAEAKAPQETATEQAPPEGESHDDAPAADAPRERKEQRLPRWMKERLERERQVTAARTREQVLRELQEQGAAPPKQQPQREPDPQGERVKTLEDFDFDPTRYTEYLVEQKLEARQREEQQRAQQQKQAEAAEQFKAKIDAFEAKAGAGAWEDIESAPLNTDPKFKPLVDLFLGDEHDLEIAHHLTQNPAEADRLLSLSPLQRVREVAKLAEKFSDEAPRAPAAQPPKKTTNAPPPPKTVSGAGKPSVDVRDPNISTSDRIAAGKARKQG